MSTSPIRVTKQPTEELSREVGRYLLELYLVSQETNNRVQTGLLSERLEVRPASVTEMLSKLANRELVDYRKHEGAALTTKGQELSEMLVWRYCVTDRFFTEMLEAPVDRTVAYQIGFELPLNGLLTLANRVELPCMRACSRVGDRIVGCQPSSA